MQLSPRFEDKLATAACMVSIVWCLLLVVHVELCALEGPDELNAAVFTHQQADHLESNLHEQSAKTCYAHACAQGIVHATMRTIRESYPDSQQLAAEIISRFGNNGGDVFAVLSHYCPEYGLWFQEAGERSAIQAVQRGRWVVASFYFTASQWHRFSKYFHEHPMGVLTKEIIGPADQDTHLTHLNRSEPGHAVILTSADHGMLTFRNSWGRHWGHNGHFRVQNASVFGNIYFVDIFASRGCHELSDALRLMPRRA